MRNKSMALVLGLSLVLVVLTVGCSSAAHSIPSSPSCPEASGPTYVAQTTCWSTMSCCIQQHPLTPVESCGASARDIEEALHGARVVYEATKTKEVKHAAKGREQGDGTVAEAGEAEADAAPEPPDCQGQDHHVISRPIARQLEQHETLHGLYEPRDKRFVAKAKDKESHCGYQKWHRDVDKEVIEWLKRYGKATPEQFEEFLHEIYNRKEMLERFPNGF